MSNQSGMKKISQEELQKKYLDKLEEAMELELKTECSRRDEWASRFQTELERPGYTQDAVFHISWILQYVLDEDNRDPGDRHYEEMEIACMTPAEKDDILFSRLPRLWDELEILEKQIPPTQGDVFTYLDTLNTLLKCENERLKFRNSFLKSENESLKQALLKVCRYYSEHPRTTRNVAKDALFFLTELDQIGIPLVPDAEQEK